MKHIGRIEKIGFPDLNIETIDAKVDTGAYGTALHVNGIRSRNGKLSFWVDDPKNRLYFDKFKVINVKSSFGKSQKRYSKSKKVILTFN